MGPEGPQGLQGQQGEQGLVIGITLVEKLQWLQTFAASNTVYTIALTDDEVIDPQILSYPGKNNIYIWLIGMGEERTISLSDSGPLFTIDSGVTLILDRNITLKGRSPNTDPLVIISSEGTLEMNTGAKITDNTGGGVNISGGKFTMNGGDISGNTVGIEFVYDSETYNLGGGVYVGSESTFNMYGGAIHGNSSDDLGGGVGVNASGIFTMYGGTIYGNTAEFGAGVFVFEGTFALKNGVISNNITAGSGGGVYASGTFSMNNGTISNNTSDAGGGVYVDSYGTFTMDGGEITSNITAGSGGGVHIEGGTLTMLRGVISGNSAEYGGGVSVKDGDLKMVNGIIYGLNEANVSLRNTAANEGAALYLSSDGVAQCGTFTNGIWEGIDLPLTVNGYHIFTDDTVKVINGELQ